MVYDVDTTEANKSTFVANVPASNLLGIDASETSDMVIVSGSDTMADVFVERRRVHELSWTFKYATFARVQDGTRPIKLFAFA